MKHTSRTLLALAVLSPAAFALDVKDDDLKLALKLQLQIRAEKSWAKDTTGQQYNLTENVANQEGDDMDFYVRRARIGFAGTWKGEYKFAYLLRNDDMDKSVQSVTVYNDVNNNGKQDAGEKTQTVSNGITSNRVPVTHYAYIERIIKQEDLGIEHSLKMGLDYAFFNGSEGGGFSSSSFLFPNQRATGSMLAPRGVGAAYKVSGKRFILGLDVQNNTGDTAGASLDGSSNGGEGLFYGTRLQVIPFDSDEKGHMKTVESFLGKDGQGVLISAELGVNQNDNTSATTNVNTTAYGFEVLGHYDGLTVLAEYRQIIAAPQVQDSTAESDKEKTVGTCYLVQAGYAMPLGDQVIEPAFRFTRLNNKAQSDAALNAEVNNFGAREWGASGYSYDAGVNYYLHGHSNKVQLAYQHWRSEAGQWVGTDWVAPQADVVRFQWQLSF